MLVVSRCKDETYQIPTTCGKGKTEFVGSQMNMGSVVIQNFEWKFPNTYSCDLPAYSQKERD